MPDGQLIEFDRATKRFGAVAAVSDFSARIGPGVVTGFLGPNGAGKTTTLRMLLGLERPTSGTATIGGSRYAELRSPARVIGAMLDDPAFRGRRTVERHLIAAAKAGGVPLSRVGELISFVGLGDEVESRIAALSLGMRQRLSAATALIGDPGVLVLDEPANGLDPEGIRWMRTLIRGLADEGRTVLVSSHVLSEVEQIADEILVISRGELKFAGTMEALADPRTGPVVVDALDRDALSESLTDAGFDYEILRSGLTVRGSDAATIGRITAHAGVALTTLQQRGPTLEDVFLDLVNDRYVAPPAPVPDETDTLFTLAAESEDASDPERLRLDSLNDPEVNADDSSTRDVERAERVETSPEASDAVEESAPVDDRPLPGLAGLAAVASMFATPVTDPNSAAAAVESVDAETSEEDDTADEHAADASDEAHDESEPVAEDDATRVIDVVPTFESESGSEPEGDIDHPAGEESAGEGEQATDDEPEQNGEPEQNDEREQN
ncbi:ATP-binding cassette domain-containing protein [Microbacterium sp. Bi121]|uniref:ABC transporter ATP-binding protein n=1 Tax=Microbacterium sp. Bi121 TaxID=2822348 RepID=UPI001DDEF760|nr:ATP-binding cassette domain-containing protein [Microbacterium sp. Bi121]CAH0153056.1 putative ABC transporter ATP-binding protein YxlF [Microbacterium sp. Bi121]